MTFKSPTQPFCRWCGKAINKATQGHYPAKPGDTSRATSAFRTHNATAYTPADCQKLTNMKVVSVRYSHKATELVDYDGTPLPPRYVVWFSSWDGESYENEFFCTGTCATAMGYAAVSKHGLATKAYRDAVAGARS